jgi:hypothetical protein
LYTLYIILWYAFLLHDASTNVHKFGRNRDSIAGIELEVQNLFSQHPAAEYDEYGVISLPVSAVPDILQQNPGESLLSDEEMDRFLNVLEASGGRVRVDTVVQLYAIKTKDSAVEDEDESALQLSPERDSPTSHSTSQESEDYPPPPLPPKGSDSDVTDSPFDAKSRQRSRPPLAPPSSFGTKKPLPVHGRRRSDAGAYPLSDSEVSHHFVYGISKQSVYSLRHHHPVGELHAHGPPPIQHLPVHTMYISQISPQNRTPHIPQGLHLDHNRVMDNIVFRMNIPCLPHPLYSALLSALFHPTGKISRMTKTTNMTIQLA